MINIQKNYKYKKEIKDKNCVICLENLDLSQIFNTITV